MSTEQALLITPNLLGLEPRCSGQLLEFFNAVFVRIFRMHGFSRLKSKDMITHRHYLVLSQRELSPQTLSDVRAVAHANPPPPQTLLSMGGGGVGFTRRGAGPPNVCVSAPRPG
jgi:hypothetical protein